MATRHGGSRFVRQRHVTCGAVTVTVFDMVCRQIVRMYGFEDKLKQLCRWSVSFRHLVSPYWLCIGTLALSIPPSGSVGSVVAGLYPCTMYHTSSVRIDVIVFVAKYTVLCCELRS